MNWLLLKNSLGVGLCTAILATGAGSLAAVPWPGRITARMATIRRRFFSGHRMDSHAAIVAGIAIHRLERAETLGAVIAGSGPGVERRVAHPPSPASTYQECHIAGRGSCFRARPEPIRRPGDTPGENPSSGSVDPV